MLTIVNYKKDEYNFPALLVLGCFDAIHIGHAELLKKAKLQAKINGLDLGVMMFNTGKGGSQLYTFEERCSFLEKYNVKFVLNIDFTEEFKKTSAADFLSTVESFINVKGYMSGKDFRFGAGAKGKSATLKKYAEDEDNGIWYMPVKDVLSQGEKVSTTLIKSCLEQGSISRANELLGRNFSVTGTVCDGSERGTAMGIPTANMQYPENKAHIKQGVYGVEVQFEGNTYKGVANFGSRPTFGEDAPVLETYILDYDGDLYGKEVTISFINYIRGIRKFVDADALCAQIKEDLTHIGEPDSSAEDEPLDMAEVTELKAAPEITEAADVVPEQPIVEVAEEVTDVAEEPTEPEVTEEVTEVTEEPTEPE
ncbi:MAG: riboflavin biosynthesis protein RibF, partial [Clostridia bacterium]|nr:riboflavin biosynthesis protein RibF [Clostridia bacterium]